MGQTDKVIKGEARRTRVAIKVQNVQINGVWMQCEYVRNTRGLFRVLMLADVDFDSRARAGDWRQSLQEAAELRYGQIEPCRKVSILIPAERALFTFRQALKRDLLGASTHAMRTPVQARGIAG